MKTEVIRLESVIKHGVGGAGAGAINLIYSILLQKHKLDFYSYIFINQIDEELQEFVIINKNQVDINIRYPAPEDFEQKTTAERNHIRLDVVHTAMLRLVEKDKRMIKVEIEAIRKEIISKHFYFEFVWKEWCNPVDESFIAELVINPLEGWFDFYIMISKSNQNILKKLIYSGKPTDYYINQIFYSGRWESNEKFIVEDRNKEAEINIIIGKNEVKYINHSPYESPPFFEMMRVDLSKVENERAYRNWLHSLPPDIAAVITYEAN